MDAAQQAWFTAVAIPHPLITFLPGCLEEKLKQSSIAMITHLGDADIFDPKSIAHVSILIRVIGRSYIFSYVHIIL